MGCIMSTSIRKVQADKAYDTLTNAAYTACLLHELFDAMYANGEASYQLSECAVKGLAELNRQMFHAVMDGRNMYSELVKE